MKKVSSCPICSSMKIKAYPAIISGFLAERIGGETSEDVQLCHCRSCGFCYYNPRLESDEVKRLYDGYRGSEYQRMRQRHEPMYTEEFNAALGKDPREQKVRKELLREYLRSERNLDEIRSVLDYGGDRGQFICDELCAAERYVYEISGTAPEPGIHSLTSLDECKRRRFDLIMCCHLLEHASDPLEELEGILTLADRDTMIYIELPYVFVFRDISASMKERVVSLGLTLIPQTLIDVFAQRFRDSFIMHEHINFFNGSSLRELLERSGLDVLRLDVPSDNIGPEQHSIIRCLARKKSVSGSDDRTAGDVTASGP